MRNKGWIIDNDYRKWVGHKCNPFDSKCIEKSYVPFARFTRQEF
jgi:hypothetical protein